MGTSGRSPWGASTRDIGSGVRQVLTSVLSPGRLSQALGAWASTGAGKGDIRSHARGVGGPGSDPEKQWSKDPGKDDLGGSAATEDPGPAHKYPDPAQFLVLFPSFGKCQGIFSLAGDMRVHPQPKKAKT